LVRLLYLPAEESIGKVPDLCQEAAQQPVQEVDDAGDDGRLVVQQAVQECPGQDVDIVLRRLAETHGGSGEEGRREEAVAPGRGGHAIAVVDDAVIIVARNVVVKARLVNLVAGDVVGRLG